MFSPDDFGASDEQAEVVIKSNTIEVIDVDTYRIVGAIHDRGVSWPADHIDDTHTLPVCFLP